MRNLPIASASSRQAEKWHNGTISYVQLREKLKNTTYTAESMEEYAQMSVEEKAIAKDVGGFVAGVLKDGRRTVKNVESRSMVALDADQITPEFISTFEESFPWAAMFYTTHGHTEAAPRGRIIIPLTRDVTVDEFDAVSRYVASQFGMDCFDPCSYTPNQLMFWPSTPRNGVFVFKDSIGDWLNPDAILSAHPDWHDPTTLPISTRERKRHSAIVREAQNPLEKDGVVGAFCRTYTITDAIDSFLGDVYAPVVDGERYTYISGSTTGGLVVYDDKFAYSHHATDPASHQLCNAFDLVRIHLFGKLDDRESYEAMCDFAMEQEEVKNLYEHEQLERAKKDFIEDSPVERPANTSTTAQGGSAASPIKWVEPIPLTSGKAPEFPLDALPKDIRDYVVALSENVQTPVDMAGCAALGVIATCLQGKYLINGKPGWTEPLNLFVAEIAPPSERKSAIQHAMVQPISDYEDAYNKEHAGEIEQSRMNTRIMVRKQKAIEDKAAKGKATDEEVRRIAEEIANNKEKRPLRLYADDITPEKLTSVMANNGGKMAVLSSEAGIFDILAGEYSKSVNIDVVLKGYSGDPIRVDRIGRESEYIKKPALTMLLMAQPSAISRVIGNNIFKGRGLTVRFLFSMPETMVGKRKFDTPPIPEDVERAYHECIRNMLEEEAGETPELITVSPGARSLMREFINGLEPKLVEDFVDINEWCGKLAGNTLRIAGLLYRAGMRRYPEFLSERERLVVDAETMRNAIRLGHYFLDQALRVFNTIPENGMFDKARRVLKMLIAKNLTDFNRREAMRNCPSFKKAEAIQPTLDFLEEYGYIAKVNEQPINARGRHPMPRYCVNPWVMEHYNPNSGGSYSNS